MNLKPPENKRPVRHRCCYTCRYRVPQSVADGEDDPCPYATALFICQRDGEIVGDEDLWWICDGYKAC